MHQSLLQALRQLYRMGRKEFMGWRCDMRFSERVGFATLRKPVQHPNYHS
jgi:hypothetical protein